MRSLLYLTGKNLTLLLRAKSSALIVVFAPLLLILILGLSYSTSSTNLNIGIYSSSYTDEVNSFITLLKEKDFNIVTYNTNVEDCVKDLKLEIVHTCISVPPSFKMENNQQKEIVFYIDQSKINLVWMIQEIVGNKFDLKSQQVSQEIAQGLLTSISDANTQIGTQSSALGIVKDKTNSASDSITSSKSTLTGMDLSVPPDPYDLAAIQNVVSNLVITKTKLAAAVTDINSANLSSSEKTNIKALLTAAQTEVDTAYNSANGTTADTLGGNLQILVDEFALISSKLQNASTAIVAASTSLDTTSASLQESLTSLGTVQTGLADIQTKLSSQKVTDASTIAAPLITKIEKVNTEGTYLNYTFSIILVLVLMFSSLLLGTTLVMMEKNSPAFLRNFFVPIRKTTFVIATYLTNLVLILIQLVIILGLAYFFLPELSKSLLPIALILFLAASVFTFFGMILGYIFVSEETGVLASISLGSLFLFLSGTILPLESLSPWLRAITIYNPFVIAEKLLRQVFVFNTNLSTLWMELLMLFGYALVLLVIILMAESFLHKHLLQRLLKEHHRVHLKNDNLVKKP